MNADERRWDELKEKIVAAYPTGRACFGSTPSSSCGAGESSVNISPTYRSKTSFEDQASVLDFLTSSAFICVHPRLNLFDSWMEAPISADRTN